MKLSLFCDHQCVAGGQSVIYSERESKQHDLVVVLI